MPLDRQGPAPLETRVWMMVFGVVLAMAILRGIRMPGRWATTHYLFGYDFGFMKRAFFGDALLRLSGSWTSSYFFLAAIALAIFAVIIGLIVHLATRVPAGDDRAPFLLVFAASPAIAFAAHLVGYLEQVGYLALLAIVVAHGRWRLQIAMAIIAAILLPLVHEASILWVGALSVLALFLAAASGDGEPPKRSRLAVVAVVAGLWLASTAGMMTLGRVSQEHANALRDARTQFFDIRPRQDAFQALTVTLGESITDMRRRWADRATQVDMAYSLAVFGPAAIFLGVLALRQARRIPAGARLPDGAIVLTVLAIASPMLLHVVGWDRHRWNAMAAFNAGLSALMLLRASHRWPQSYSAVGRPGTLLAVAITIALWSFAADPVFFDAYGPDHPPFAQKVQFLLEAIRTGDHNLWIPAAGR